MLELCLLILAIVALLGICLAMVVVLKNGSFRLHIGTAKKEDVLLVETEHRDNSLDK